MSNNHRASLNLSRTDKAARTRRLLIVGALSVLGLFGVARLGSLVVETPQILAVLFGAIVGFVLIYRVRAKWLLLAFFAYVPLSLRIPLSGATTLPSSFLLLYLSIVRFLLFERQTRSRLISWSWVHVWAVIFLALSTVSTLAGLNVAESVRKMFYVVHFALVLFTVSMILRPEDLPDLLVALSVGISVLALIGIAQFVLSIVIGRRTLVTFTLQTMVWTVGPKATALFIRKGNPINWYTKFGAMRAVGVGITAMQFAQNLLFAFLPAAVTTFTLNRLPRRRFYRAVMLIGLAGIVASFSRGAWLAGAVGLATAIAFCFVSPSLLGRIGSLRFIVTLILVVGLIFLALPGRYRQNLWDMLLSIANIEGETTDSYVGSNQVRFLTYRVAWEMIKQQPLLGVGPGNFSAAADNITNVTAIGYAADAQRGTPHNQYLLTASEMGLPAMLVYVLLGLAAFRDLARVALRGRDMQLRLIAAGLCATLLSLSVYYLVETNPYIPDVNSLLWGVAGISAVARASLFQTAKVPAGSAAEPCVVEGSACA